MAYNFKQNFKKNRMIKIDQISTKYFIENLFKIGYSKKIPKNIKKNKYLNLLVKAFQRRFRQELVNGKIDKECLLISENLLNKFG